jgi:hypothetical protein
MKSKPTDPWSALRAQLTVKGNRPVGPNWKTMKEIIALTGQGKTRTRLAVLTEVEAKRMEVFRGSEVARNGCPAPQIWYRPKAKGQK